MLIRLMSKTDYLIMPKGTKFTGSFKLGLKLEHLSHKRDISHFTTSATYVHYYDDKILNTVYKYQAKYQVYIKSHHA